MSKHELDEMDTTGYFLPEESQFRLKKLHGHMVFLSQLAQPRTYDEEETGWGPQISGMQLAVCLEVLAAQTGRVLDEVTWPAEREVGRRQSQARDEDEAEDPVQADEVMVAGAQEDDEAGEALSARAQDVEAGVVAPAGPQGDAVAEAAGATPQDDDEPGEAGVVADAGHADDPLVFGMTLDQLDTLNRLHDRLHAYGDLVFGVERTDLADGTLTVLGDVIFEVAEAASALMDKVAGQTLPDASRRRNRVREERAVYGSPAGRGLAFDAAMPMLPPPADARWRPQAATRH
ncbi:XAC0095 family protein [Luteimonas sp. R10]|uniref:XAC0095 family protein n=1 Tax=Luteimonas sp. R10 TaxID=3108176 RepID=UPI003091FA25|nr:hypothetical protein U3649_09625 [Luteimonas sp. R10]